MSHAELDKALAAYGQRRAKPVGKKMGSQIYAHRQYEKEIVPAAVLKAAKKRAGDLAKGYNVVKYDNKNGNVSFLYSPDFDTADEPIVDWHVTVAKGKEPSRRANGMLYHHKWQFVKDGYRGFDVAASKLRSLTWLPHIQKGESSRIGKPEVWDSIRTRWGDTVAKRNPYRRAPINVYPIPNAPTRMARPEYIMGYRNPQTLSSAATSLKQVPMLHRKLASLGVLPRGMTIDYGGGGYDLATEFLKEHGVRNKVYDPYNRTPAHNRKVKALKTRPVAVLLSNVLNVINDEETRLDVLRECRRMAKGAPVYISVYEGKGDGRGRRTGPDQWQENRKTKSYLPEVETVFGQAGTLQGGGGKIIVAV
jgi:hypothetical protein